MKRYIFSIGTDNRSSLKECSLETIMLVFVPSSSIRLEENIRPPTAAKAKAAKTVGAAPIMLRESLGASILTVGVENMVELKGDLINNYGLWRFLGDL